MTNHPRPVREALEGEALLLARERVSWLSAAGVTLLSLRTTASLGVLY